MAGTVVCSYTVSAALAGSVGSGSVFRGSESCGTCLYHTFVYVL
jgi:hypothetical protein